MKDNTKLAIAGLVGVGAIFLLSSKAGAEPVLGGGQQGGLFGAGQPLEESYQPSLFNFGDPNFPQDQLPIGDDPSQSYSLYSSSTGATLFGGEVFSARELDSLSSGGAVTKKSTTYKASTYPTFSDAQAKSMLSPDAYAKYSANKPSGLSGTDLISATKKSSSSSGGSSSSGSSSAGSSSAGSSKGSMASAFSSTPTGGTVSYGGKTYTIQRKKERSSR